jgi:putative ABC transport system substrate-binding protein
MRRREFIAGLGGAAAWPLAARAQQPRSPVVGVLSATSSTNAELTDLGLNLAVFRNGLKELGYVDGQNVEIDLPTGRVSDFDRGPKIWFAVRLP